MIDPAEMRRTIGQATLVRLARVRQEFPVKVFAPQRFLTFNNASVEDACLALACLAARFS